MTDGIGYRRGDPNAHTRVGAESDHRLKGSCIDENAAVEARAFLRGQLTP